MKNKNVILALFALVLIWIIFFRKKSGYESSETDSLLASSECAAYNS